MSTIAATGSARVEALDLPVSSNAAGLDRTSPSSRPATPSARSGDRPAVSVDLSDSTKALLERAKIARTVADKLDQLIDALKDDGADAQPGKPLNSGTKEPFSVSPHPSAPRATETKWEAGAPYGDATQSDAEFIKSTALDVSLTSYADYLDEHDFPPEAGQNLRDAVRTGALKFQKASDIHGLNFHSTHTFGASAVGGGYSILGSVGQNPTGATKEALGQGRDLAMWSADRGEIYITW